MRERTRFEAEGADLGTASSSSTARDREVFPPDSLTKVEDNRAAPFRWICHIETRTLDGKLATGTGFLVGPRHVLTSAHVIYPIDPGKERPRQKVESIRVYPARHGSREPFGGHDANGWVIRPEWNAGRMVDPVFDYGLIRLRKNLDARIGFWGRDAGSRFVNVDPATLAGRTLSCAGYPFRQGVNELAARVMWRSEGRATRRDHPRVFLHDVDTRRGQSGCPIWTRDENGLTVVGIHHGGVPRDTPTGNLAVLVTQEVVDQVTRWIRTFERR